jgi:hypothetical protein
MTSGNVLLIAVSVRNTQTRRPPAGPPGGHPPTEDDREAHVMLAVDYPREPTVAIGCPVVTSLDKPQRTVEILLRILGSGQALPETAASPRRARLTGDVAAPERLTNAQARRRGQARA